MQITGNLFCAVIFVSAIGSIFTVISLFADYVLRCNLPLWFSFFGMMLYCVPFLSPDESFFMDWQKELFTAL